MADAGRREVGRRMGHPGPCPRPQHEYRTSWRLASWFGGHAQLIVSGILLVVALSGGAALLVNAVHGTRYPAPPVTHIAVIFVGALLCELVVDLVSVCGRGSGGRRRPTRRGASPR